LRIAAVSYSPVITKKGAQVAAHKWSKEELDKARRLLGIETAEELDEAMANFRAYLSILRECDNRHRE
jgi:hypothetical protein